MLISDQHNVHVCNDEEILCKDQNSKVLYI